MDGSRVESQLDRAVVEKGEGDLWVNTWDLNKEQPVK
jgi:hypothetical protein